MIKVIKEEVAVKERDDNWSKKGEKVFLFTLSDGKVIGFDWSSAMCDGPEITREEVEQMIEEGWPFAAEEDGGITIRGMYKFETVWEAEGEK